MLDLIPFRAPPFLAAAANRAGTYFNLDILHLHVHEIVFAALLYHTICVNVSPWISAVVCPKTYPKLPRRTKLNWDVHVVSLFQSLLINGLALYVMFADEERANMDWRERVWGYTGAGGLVQAFALGYFLWDLYISILYVDLFGWGLLAHAMSAFYVFSLGFRPFTNYYAPVFILYELSSPFLNFHWFFDKLEMTGSNAQLINGIFLMASFFGSRLVWGIYQTFSVFGDVFKALEYQETPEGKAWLQANAKLAGVVAKTTPSAKSQVLHYTAGKEVPWWYAYTYLGSNITLTILNIYWFGKMIETIRKRFEPPFGTKKPEKAPPGAAGVTVGRGILQDGTKTVEIDSRQVRRRKGALPDEVPPPN